MATIHHFPTPRGASVARAVQTEQGTSPRSAPSPYRGNVKPIDPDVITRIMGEEPFACLDEEPRPSDFLEGFKNAIIFTGFAILGIGAALMVFA